MLDRLIIFLYHPRMVVLNKPTKKLVAVKLVSGHFVLIVERNLAQKLPTFRSVKP